MTAPDSSWGGSERSCMLLHFHRTLCHSMHWIFTSLQFLLFNGKDTKKMLTFSVWLSWRKTTKTQFCLTFFPLKCINNSINSVHFWVNVCIHFLVNSQLFLRSLYNLFSSFSLSLHKTVELHDGLVTFSYCSCPMCNSPSSIRIWMFV